jgi:hypothetical protein
MDGKGTDGMNPRPQDPFFGSPRTMLMLHDHTESQLHRELASGASFPITSADGTPRNNVGEELRSRIGSASPHSAIGRQRGAIGARTTGAPQDPFFGSPRTMLMLHDHTESQLHLGQRHLTLRSDGREEYNAYLRGDGVEQLARDRHAARGQCVLISKRSA